MAIAGMPEIINNFNMYNSGNRLLGITGEVQLPPFESILSETSGVGILGTYNAIAVGHYGSMEQMIPFRCVNEDYFTLIHPGVTTELMLRGAVQYMVKADQGMDSMNVRIVYRGRCKTINIGTIRQRGQMDSQITLELTYILVEMDGKKRFEHDKINEVLKINGVDVLAKIRSQC